MAPRGGPREGAGRPPLPEDEQRRQVLRVRLTDAELEALEAAAADAGEALSAYARRVLVRHLNRRRPPR